MKDLILVSNFNILECNFDEIEQYLKSLIDEKYNIVVTEDSVKDAKNVRAELNKGKKALEQAWREKKAELEAPIKDLNEKAKRLFQLCDEASANIDNQVKQFEAKKRELAVTLCAEYRDQVCEVKKLDPSLIDVSGFSNLSYVTEKGSLASAGKQAVDNLILQKLAEIAEQKQRELEAQMKIEKIKQQAREELLHQQAQQAQLLQEEQEECNTQAPQQAQQQTQTREVQEQAKNGSVILNINIALAISTKGEYSQDMQAKVEKWVRSEIEKNQSLAKALKQVVVSKA